MSYTPEAQVLIDKMNEELARLRKIEIAAKELCRVEHSDEDDRFWNAFNALVEELK